MIFYRDFGVDYSSDIVFFIYVIIKIAIDFQTYLFSGFEWINENFCLWVSIYRIMVSLGVFRSEEYNKKWILCIIT